MRLSWKLIPIVFAVTGAFSGPALAVEYRELWLGDVAPVFANDHHAGMRLHLAIDKGKVTRAAVLVPMASPAPQKVEADRFSIDDARLKGSFTYRLERYKKDDQDIAITLDAGLAGNGDKGTWTAAADGRERKGTLRVAPTLTAAELSGEAVDVWVHGIRHKSYDNRRGAPPLLISGTADGMRLADGRFEHSGVRKFDTVARVGATFGPGYARHNQNGPIHALTVAEFKVDPTRVTLRLVDKNAGYEIAIDGERLGRLVMGTAKRTGGQGAGEGYVVGQTGPANDPTLNDYGKSYTTPLALPLDRPAAAPESFPVDPKLADQALKETAITLPHGRPDRTDHQLVVASYWPGRPGLQVFPKITSKHPPGHASIAEFPPVEGAARYRFTIEGRNLQETHETDNPWFDTLPFYRRQADLKSVRVTMVPLGADGSVIDDGHGFRKLYVRSGPSEFWNERMLRGGSGVLHSRYAPAFDFTPVEGATSYRYQVLRRDDVLAAFTGPTPWESLSKVWLEPALVEAIGQELRVTIQALDPDDQPIGDKTEERRIVRRRPFPGLAVTVDPDDVDKRLLAYTRWLRDHSVIWGNFDADIAAAHAQYPTSKAQNTVVHRTYAISHSMRQLARLTDDPRERHRALATIERTVDWAQNSYGGATGLPSQMVAWFYPHFWLGLAYLDLYEATGDERWREAAIYVARRMVQFQLPTGTWGWTTRQGEMLVVGSSHNGQDNADHDASEVLYFLGRLRHDLKVDDFRENERRAYEWVMKNSASSFYWRSQWSHAEMGGGNISTKSAVFFARYLLEYADEEDRDLKLTDRILRYCEDQFVTWTDPDPDADAEDDDAPFIHVRNWGDKTRAGATANLAAAYLLMEKHTGDALFGAKGRALLQAVLAAQDHQTGNIPGTMQPGKRTNLRAVIHYGILTRGLAESAALLREHESH